MFAATGSCPDGAKCKLQHRKQKTRKRKSEAIARYTCTPVKLGLLLSMPNMLYVFKKKYAGTSMNLFIRYYIFLQ